MADSNRLRAHTKWFAVLAAVATLWISTAAALAESSTAWSITEMSGRVNIVRSGAAPVSLTTGDQLRPGDMIETAAESSAILVRNGESIVIAPNSRMGLPSANDSGFATLILQQFGTLLLRVEKQQQQHFEVKTPYLAAVVKGTTFTVNVDTAGASVHVLEGAVQVASKAGMSALVRPGQTALVSSVPGSGLSIQGGPTNAPAQSSGSAAQSGTTDKAVVDVPPAPSGVLPVTFTIEETIGSLDIDIAAASNGLIHAAQAPGQVGKANTGQGAGKSNAPGQTVSANAGNGGGLGSAGALGLGPTVGNPGGGQVGGNPHGGPVAAGHGGGLPANASLVTQLTASPGSQGNNGNGKNKK